MPQVVEIIKAGDGQAVAFECPGCGETHRLRVNGGKPPSWTWNGSVESPTLMPSILANLGRWTKDEPKDRICHSFVKDGQIQFLSDCTHDLAGQTVPLRAVEPE